MKSLNRRSFLTKSALALIIEEILRAGIEQIAIVIAPGDEAAFCAAAGPHAARLTFIEQAQPLGYTHAVACAARMNITAPGSGVITWITSGRLCFRYSQQASW